MHLTTLETLLFLETQTRTPVKRLVLYTADTKLIPTGRFQIDKEYNEKASFLRIPKKKEKN